jgi:uncharacterized protein (TIGR02599 family)
MNLATIRLCWKIPPSAARAPGPRAFTLVELLISMAIVGLLLVVLLQMTNATSTLWRRTTGKAEQFRAAREGFESITRQLGQATLNTYWDYDNGNAPTKFIRQSELRFTSGPMTTPPNALAPAPASPQAWPLHGVFFHAPLGNTSTEIDQGLPMLLNTCGYFVEFNTDRGYQPGFLQNVVPEQYRFRLMELKVPSENITIYNQTSGGTGSPVNLHYTQRDWFTNFLTNSSAGPTTVRVLAENVVALIILPRLSSQDEQRRAAAGQPPLAANYFYDSTALSGGSASTQDPEINPTNQLPPVVQVAMIAIDEASAARWAAQNGPAMPDLDSADKLFTDSRQLFDDPTTPAPGDGDLSKLETYLTAKQKLTCRVFSAAVAIHAAKWSRTQTN